MPKPPVGTEDYYDAWHKQEPLSKAEMLAKLERTKELIEQWNALPVEARIVKIKERAAQGLRGRPSPEDVSERAPESGPPAHPVLGSEHFKTPGAF